MFLNVTRDSAVMFTYIKCHNCLDRDRDMERPLPRAAAVHLSVRNAHTALTLNPAPAARTVTHPGHRGAR